MKTVSQNGIILGFQPLADFVNSLRYVSAVIKVPSSDLSPVGRHKPPQRFMIIWNIILRLPQSSTPMLLIWSSRRLTKPEGTPKLDAGLDFNGLCCVLSS
ncbi:MAG: hypothetical protein CVT97_09240 [Bacteroidetes bacterium HGW-Bacteroidetes-14]|nr:MAG: hypothetical protein CVT97_09240 [Bacteroidetes bacterium HGW-Bacteroidetes-14]